MTIEQILREPPDCEKAKCSCEGLTMFPECYDYTAWAQRIREAILEAMLNPMDRKTALNHADHCYRLGRNAAIAEMRKKVEKL